MYPIPLASGRRIKEDVKVDYVRNYDTPTTISELLGLEMSGLSGRVRDEIPEKQ